MPGNRMKFIIGGSLILFAVIYLIITSTSATAEYFLTVDEIIAQGPGAVGTRARISGAVIGETIGYDPETLVLTFQIAHITSDNAEIESLGGLAAALNEAVVDPMRNHLTISYTGPKPDLLTNEAQAIATGQLGEDGIFYADELLLKCPTKYEEEIPEQVDESGK
jgi:cytochrome c-type biogenesis protein CcmE